MVMSGGGALDCSGKHRWSRLTAAEDIVYSKPGQQIAT